MARHNEFGAFGESLACELLELKGYRILATNFRYRRSEIDVLACKGEVLAAVEVKSRSSAGFGKPEEFVGESKIRLMQSAVNAFVDRYDLELEVRFDIISVLKTKAGLKIDHFPDAFYHF